MVGRLKSLRPIIFRMAGRPNSSNVTVELTGLQAKSLTGDYPQTGEPTVTFELFGRPAILKMMGRKDLSRPTIVATLGQDIINEDGRRIFARVRVEKAGDEWRAILTGQQGSGILTSMLEANGLDNTPERLPGSKGGVLK